MSALRHVVRQALAEFLLGLACCVVAFAVAVYGYMFNALTWGVLFSLAAVGRLRRVEGMSQTAAVKNLTFRLVFLLIPFALVPQVGGRPPLIDQIASLNQLEFGFVYPLLLASWLGGIVAVIVSRFYGPPPVEMASEKSGASQAS
jgi:hypothetical protein